MGSGGRLVWSSVELRRADRTTEKIGLILPARESRLREHRCPPPAAVRPGTRSHSRMMPNGSRRRERPCGGGSRVSWSQLLLAPRLAAAACAPTEVPLDTALAKEHLHAEADTLLVLLPGADTQPDEFAREGFGDATGRAPGWRSTCCGPTRTSATTTTRQDRRRLSDDVVAPARSRGYRAIWLVGISLGGFGGWSMRDAPRRTRRRCRPGALSGRAPRERGDRQCRRPAPAGPAPLERSWPAATCARRTNAAVALPEGLWRAPPATSARAAALPGLWPRRSPGTRPPPAGSGAARASASTPPRAATTGPHGAGSGTACCRTAAAALPRLKPGSTRAAAGCSLPSDSSVNM